MPMKSKGIEELNEWKNNNLKRNSRNFCLIAIHDGKFRHQIGTVNQSKKQTHIYIDMSFLSKPLSHTAACIHHNCACRPVRNGTLSEHGKVYLDKTKNRHNFP